MKFKTLPSSPRIVTDLPGPDAKRILARDGIVLSQGGIRPYPLVMRRGQGLWVEDVDGNIFLDFTSGIGALPLGHCHPRIIQAIRCQLDCFLHMSSAYNTYEVMVSLAERITRAAPLAQQARVFFTNSGTEANEGAIKLARWSTGRPYVLSFFGAFHGRTLGSMSHSAMSSDHRRRVGPLLPGVFQAPYPNQSKDLGSVKTLERIEELFETVLPPEELAAVIVEPIQGGAGLMVLPDDQFFPRLRDLADKYGFLLIVDEVYTGIGRTGKMWAVEHWGVNPDIICFAKAIASGMPLGGFIARQGVMEWPHGTHTSTFGGNPVSCAAALATLDVLEEENLIDNAARVGELLLDRIQQLRRREGIVPIQVCGKGLMICLELQSSEEALSLLTEAYQHGLLLLAAGKRGVRLAPALSVTADEATVALRILSEAFEKLGKEGSQDREEAST